MGGTFDPPHIGHLIMAECAKESLGLDVVIFIPTGDTKYKDKHTSAEDRYNMVSLAISGRNGFLNSDIEIKRDGYSFTADTIQELADIYADSQLYFIVGADSLDYMDKWKEPERIFSKCKIVAIERAGYHLDEMQNKAYELKNLFSADIIFVDMPRIDISSSYIRNNISKGKSVKYLLADNVIEYIQNKKLYCGE